MHNKSTIGLGLLIAGLGLYGLILPASAQDGGGMGGGGMGGGRGGGGGGHHRGGGRGGGKAQAAQPSPDGRPAGAVALKQPTGVITVAAQGKSLSSGSVTSDKPDVSAVYAEMQAVVKIDSAQLISHGNATLVDDTRSSGINSALLIASGASATMTGGGISTTGTGGNGAFVTDAGSHLTLQGVAISTRASGAYGLEASGGAVLDAGHVTIATLSDHAAAVATGKGGGNVTLTGGSFTTGGPSSPALVSTGMLSGDGVTVATDRSDALVVTDRHNLTLNNSTISSGGNGAMLYAESTPDGAGAGPSQGPGGHARMAAGGGAQPVNFDPSTGMEAPVAATGGPAANHQGFDRMTALTLTGGKLSAADADFYVTNTRASITLSNVDLTSQSGVIVRSVSDQWGPLGRNGGDAHVIADNQVLNGNFVTDVISSIRVSLSNNSHFTGKATQNVDMKLDATSTWTLSDDTSVGKLEDAAISGDTVSNITGNGHNLNYDETRNAVLGGKTYQLTGGGTLAPGI